MRTAWLLGPGNIAVGDAPEPRPAAGEVLLQTELAGICGTDVSFYLGHRIVPYPFVLGHEVIGRVAAVGEGVTKFAAGQRVLVEPNYPCGSCRLCLAGRGAVCAQKGSPGVNLPGCFAEYFAAPAEFVWPLPDAISDQDAATIEPLAVSLHGFLQSGAKAGDTVAVLGCGVVGLLLIHAAVAAGVRVIAHDRFANKLEMARSLGAEPPAQDDGYRADVAEGERDFRIRMRRFTRHRRTCVEGRAQGFSGDSPGAFLRACKFCPAAPRARRDRYPHVHDLRSPEGFCARHRPGCPGNAPSLVCRDSHVSP